MDNRFRLSLFVVLSALGVWAAKAIWFDDAERSNDNFLDDQVEIESNPQSEDESPGQVTSPEIAFPQAEGAQRLDVTTDDGNSPDTQLAWWEDREVFAEYCEEFSSSLVHLKDVDSTSDLEERLSHLRNVDLETLERSGLSTVDWASLGELSKSYQVEIVKNSIRNMRDIDLAHLTPEDRQYYIQEEPFLVRPESLLKLVSERTIALDQAQLGELETIYWGALGARARAEDFITFPLLADARARMVVGEESGGLPRLEPGSEFEPAELAEARAVMAEANANYISQLLFFIRQNDL